MNCWSGILTFSGSCDKLFWNFKDLNVDMFQDVNAEWSVEASMSKFLLGVVVNTSQLSQAHVRRFNWQYSR